MNERTTIIRNFDPIFAEEIVIRRRNLKEGERPNLLGCVLTSIDFSTNENANLLQRADLRNADLTDTNFILTDAVLEGVFLDGKALETADLRSLNLNGAILFVDDLIPDNLKMANLERAILLVRDLRVFTNHGAILVNIEETEEAWLWEYEMQTAFFSSTDKSNLIINIQNTLKNIKYCIIR